MGPCLCGDPYCSSCGVPGLAEMEAAIENASEKLMNAGLDAEEIDLAVSAGIAHVMIFRCEEAIRKSRQKQADSDRELAELEEAAYQERLKYEKEAG